MLPCVSWRKVERVSGSGFNFAPVGRSGLQIFSEILCTAMIHYPSARLSTAVTSWEPLQYMFGEAGQHSKRLCHSKVLQRPHCICISRFGGALLLQGCGHGCRCIPCALCQEARELEYRSKTSAPAGAYSVHASQQQATYPAPPFDAPQYGPGSARAVSPPASQRMSK